ncbi:MAG: hypothetical protein ACMUJM_25705 [bacterium]
MTNQEKLYRINEIVRKELQYVIKLTKQKISPHEWKYLKYQEDYLFRLHTVIEGFVSNEKSIH